MVNGYVAIGGYWGYTFEANETSTFTLDWNASILTATDPFGLAGFVFYFTSEFATPYEEMHAGTQGSLTRELIAGHRYYVQVAPHANQLGIAVPGDNYLTGQFHWTITPVAVPEPASLSLLGVGLLAIVLLRTREKRARRLRVRSGSVEFD
jgi:PEP-CTERM putative exosortase interaction domain